MPPMGGVVSQPNVGTRVQVATGLKSTVRPGNVAVWKPTSLAGECAASEFDCAVGQLGAVEAEGTAGNTA